MRALLLTTVTALALTAAPAVAQPVQLTPEEAEALKARLIQAKPNVSTVTIASFVFPGASQAYMGMPERTLVMWGSYLLACTALKVAVPDTLVAGPTKVSDLAIVGVLMGMSAYSALDAYQLALARRADYDVLINRLTERTQGLSPAAILPIRPTVDPAAPVTPP